jgi:flavin reductase (DIM6/NTAB) family NADH-FMN oxidoreductase RutF
VSEAVAQIHDGVVTDGTFDDLMAMLDSPVFVVTTQADGHPSGCLVGFATQTSAQPPSFMVGMPLASHTAEVARRSDYLAVHVLPRRQHVLAELFGGQSVEQTDAFAHCSWRGGPMGMPILDDAAAWFVAKTVSRSEVADHVVYLLDPIAAWAPESSEELLYLSDIDDFEPGQETPQRLYNSEGNEATRRYGVRFTLDLP